MSSMTRGELYRCEHCQQNVPPHTPCARVVLETRPRQYPFRAGVHRPRSKQQHGRSGVRIQRGDPRDDPGGWGYEIVREARVCPACAATLRREGDSAPP